MRPRSCLAVASLLVILAGCGGATDGPIAGQAAIEAAVSAPTASIEIGEGEPITAPADAVSSGVAVTAEGDAVDASPSSAGSAPGTSGDGSTSPSPTSSPTATDGGATPSPSPTTAPVDAGPPLALPAGTPASSVVAQAAVGQVTARVAPQDDAAPVATLAHPTAVGSPLVFLAIDTTSTQGWLQVQLPVEPNGTTGWVRRGDVTLFENPYRVEIERSSHRLQVFHLGQPWLAATIAVGTGDTPTPVGEFYLLELLAPPDPTGPYGPYAFGLSGFSEVLDSFGGADTAIIGLHGTDQPQALGTDVSFGCIRLANDVMEQLATTLPLGTPVRIT